MEEIRSGLTAFDKWSHTAKVRSCPNEEEARLTKLRLALVSALVATGVALASCSTTSTSSTTTTSGGSTSTTSAGSSSLPTDPSQPLADTAANAPQNAQYACDQLTAITNGVGGGGGEPASVAGPKAQAALRFANAAAANDSSYSNLAGAAQALDAFVISSGWANGSGSIVNDSQITNVENICNNLTPSP